MFSDWLAFFWNQIENLTAMQPGIYNIPWLFVVLQPLRLIGKYPSLILVQILSLYIIYRLSRELKISNTRMIMVFISAPVFWNFFLGQIDGLMLSAYLLPATFAVVIALIKPQTALWAGWDGIKQRPILILMVIILVVSAFIIWRWPFSAENPEGFIKPALIPPLLVGGWNWSIWPWGILVLPLFFKKDKLFGMFLSPLIFPYAGLQSLIGPILVLAAKTPGWLFFLFWTLLWLRWAWMLKMF